MCTMTHVAIRCVALLFLLAGVDAIVNLLMALCVRCALVSLHITDLMDELFFYGVHSAQGFKLIIGLDCAERQRGAAMTKKSRCHLISINFQRAVAFFFSYSTQSYGATLKRKKRFTLFIMLPQPLWDVIET